MLCEYTALATRRGFRSISTDDLIILIRYNKAKISRLRHFLQQKDVRRSVKDNSDDKGGDIIVDIGASDADLVTRIIASGGPTIETGKKAKYTKVDLVQDMQFFFNKNIPIRDDIKDKEEEEINYATLQRLKNADKRTKNITRKEYVYQSNYRQASFTFRKGKRFKEQARFGIITDSRLNNDIINILGFLIFKIVQILTKEALRVKDAEDLYKKEIEGELQNRIKRKRESSLFNPLKEARGLVQLSYV